jgi:DNA-binding winged helix-turn-helix (wHTH) protein/Tfp pilus assembly protein PilF
VRHRFGPYTLTHDRLSCDGRTVHLAAKPLGVLHALVSNAGRLTTKQAIVDAVWPDRAVSDESIARSVFLVRQALGELDARPARYIETVYGRGYRFVADVAAEPDGHAPHAVAAPLAHTDAERTALNHCIEARFRLSRRAGNLIEALYLYEQAIEAAPGFRAARVGLAECSLWLSMNGMLAPLMASARARTQLREALLVDPDDPGALASLGLLSSYFDWDVPAADAAFARALENDPADPVVHAWHGRHLTSLGRYAEARTAFDTALALEPASMAVRNVRAFVVACAGDVDFALDEICTSIELEPEHPNPRFFKALIGAFAGRGTDAVAEAQRLLPFSGEVPVLRAILGYAAAVAGDEAEARAALDYLRTTARTRYVTPTAAAFIAAALGDVDGAFRWLDRALEERCPWLALANQLPPLAPLRDDARFEAVRRAIGRPRPEG